MRKKFKTVTVERIQELDRLAIEDFGVPSLALMENAGRRTAEEILRILKKVKDPRVCIVCGLGNNAGDGFVVARHLINAGIKTGVFLIGQGRRLKHDAAVNFRILKNVKVPVKEIRSIKDLPAGTLRRATLVVDAIFGVGLNRDVGAPFRDVIGHINAHGRKVVSVDVPSGLDGTTGKIFGVCVKADVTVTFTFMKSGFLRDQGPVHVGKVVVVDIGIPVQLL